MAKNKDADKNMQEKIQNKLSSEDQYAVEYNATKKNGTATSALASKDKVKLTEEQIFDVLEIFSYGILNNLRRKDCLNYVCDYLTEKEVVVGPHGVTQKTLINYYVKARWHLEKRVLETVEEEKKAYVKAMHRIALKAENANDFKTAMAAHKEIASIANVFAAVDDSKVVINFSALKAVEAPKKDSE